ncbi:dihydroxyacetone kinase [Sphaerochaeta pleomorpha str. Grapes]|uniref:Dihydroxyacetone kinase n=1 Tax=Sphaerochaeta pleomorpha (strain ATCC BAA-1885 / DSM 22778 / Grapes) TaxID=158190 RepID=G8QXH1_SPHPG|nr:dihydroxyacetone kinase subunit L [Sphaerochaeta pleomorpha]AEV29534.1 dihydroxyacetone kinase [Sphaerochaeta pleomorpha str. Grapes]
MNSVNLCEAMNYISETMTSEKEYLIALDQQNGDGDLGISMSDGYKSVLHYLLENTEEDLGKVFMNMAGTFNESAPSSLGTITSFGMMGMAKKLKGKTDASLEDLVAALYSGIENIMKKAGSKAGEKTILDSLIPGIDALQAYQGEGAVVAFEKAAEAARIGSENTRSMKSVHGRAAYYGEKSIGIIDGGSVVGSLIFKSLAAYVQRA